MSWKNIFESIISGVFVGLSIVIANLIIDKRHSKKEFQSHLAVLLIELYTNYSSIPDIPETSQLITFEISAWELLELKLVPKLPKPIVLRTVSLYHALKRFNSSNFPKEPSDYIEIKVQISHAIDELLKKLKGFDLEMLDEITQR